MPGPGVEPRTAAYQADVLTTTLPRFSKHVIALFEILGTEMQRVLGRCSNRKRPRSNIGFKFETKRNTRIMLQLPDGFFLAGMGSECKYTSCIAW